MTWRRGEAGSTLIDRPKDAPVPDFHEWQGKGYSSIPPPEIILYVAYMIKRLIIRSEQLSKKEIKTASEILTKHLA